MVNVDKTGHFTVDGGLRDRAAFGNQLRRMGVEVGGLPPVDQNVEIIVDLMLDATLGYD